MRAEHVSLEGRALSQRRGSIGGRMKRWHSESYAPRRGKTSLLRQRSGMRREACCDRSGRGVGRTSPMSMSPRAVSWTCLCLYSDVCVGKPDRGARVRLLCEPVVSIFSLTSSLERAQRVKYDRSTFSCRRNNPPLRSRYANAYQSL